MRKKGGGRRKKIDIVNGVKYIELNVLKGRNHITAVYNKY